MADTFYLRYLQSHNTQQAGTEEFSFEINEYGLLKYKNNSSYRKAHSIKKEAYLSDSVIEEFKKIIRSSEIVEQDDINWPQGTKEDTQELEIVIDNYHITFKCGKVATLGDIQRSKDPNGLTVYYYIIQDLKSFIFSLISLHFKINPIP